LKIIDTAKLGSKRKKKMKKKNESWMPLHWQLIRLDLSTLVARPIASIAQHSSFLSLAQPSPFSLMAGVTCLQSYLIVSYRIV